jgi:ElaA protein
MDLDELLWRQFSELNATELYALLRLRSEVFVVEQQCIYLDLDGKDQESLHLLARKAETLFGYLRVHLVNRNEAKIERVVVSPNARGQSIGRQLIVEAIEEAGRRFGPISIKVAAQSHLEGFYHQFGFSRVSADYIDFGIPHCDLLLDRHTKPP